MRILILGGTTEATALAACLRESSNYAPILSLAGRTRAPDLPPGLPHRIGGFGGIAGLTAYLHSEAIAAVIDATHPFADQMTRHALAACKACAIPLARFTRPPWRRVPGDDWREVPSAAEAAVALGADPRRVFLTIGRLQLAAFAAAPQHAYLIRCIDPPAPMPDLPHSRLLLARGPYSEAAEIALLQRERIDLMVSKNSGGSATYAKIAAARHLGLKIIMITPPPVPDQAQVFEVSAVLDWLEAHCAASP